MSFRFLAADKVTDPQSAERVLTKYKNRPISMSIDSQSFSGTLLKAQADGGTLRIEFTWTQDQNQDVSDVEHVQRFANTKIGSMVRFKAGTDEFIGLLSGMTSFPEGGTVERYVTSPFVLTFAFSAQDQQPLTADSKESGIIGVPVPANIVELLPLSPNLEYDPHITVCFFPKLTSEDAEKILPVAIEAAEIVGSFDVVVDGFTTFPTPNSEGEYPHVACIKSLGLTDFHDLVVEMIEHRYPGMLDTTFALKNFNPHLTLSYSKESNPYIHTKALAWNVDHLTLNIGKKKKLPIPLSKGYAKEGGGSSYLQLGDVEIPIQILSNRDNELRIKLKDPSQATKFDKMEGAQVKLVTAKAEQELELLRVQKEGDGFVLSYRSLMAYVPMEAYTKLQYVAAVAFDRGHQVLAARLTKFRGRDEEAEEEEEPKDKEALGPGFEGTDSHIVTYVKAPQTQVIVEEPKFPRSLPLHERI